MKPSPPPNYRKHTVAGRECGTCRMGWQWSKLKGELTNGHCWGYGEYTIQPDHVCDSWIKDTSRKLAARKAAADGL